MICYDVGFRNVLKGESDDVKLVVNGSVKNGGG